MSSVRIATRVRNGPPLMPGTYVHDQGNPTFYFARHGNTSTPEKVHDIFQHLETHVMSKVTNVPPFDASSFFPSNKSGCLPYTTIPRFQNTVMAEFPSNTGPTPCCIMIRFDRPYDTEFSEVDNINVEVETPYGLEAHMSAAATTHLKDNSRSMTFIGVNLYWSDGEGHFVACMLDHARKEIVLFDSTGYFPHESHSHASFQDAAGHAVFTTIMEGSGFLARGYKFIDIRHSTLWVPVAGNMHALAAQLEDYQRLRSDQGNCGYHGLLYGCLRMMNPHCEHWEVAARMFFLMRRDPEYILRFKQFVMVNTNMSKESRTDTYHSFNPRVSMVTRSARNPRVSIKSFEYIVKHVGQRQIVTWAKALG